MYNRISASVDDCPCFSTFCNYIWSLLIVKLQIFPYTSLFTNYNIGELTSAKNDHEYYFHKCHTH